MILTDREIKKRSKELIEGYEEENVTNIGYDLQTEYFILSKNKEKVDKYELEPGESIFAATKENIRMQNDLCGKVVLKNSRIRQGLSMDAPVYQPGHHTKIFFRLTNLSREKILLKKNEKYVMIMFEQLSGIPDVLYRGQYSEEFEFEK